MSPRRAALEVAERHDGQALYEEHRTAVLERAAEIAEEIEAEEAAHAARYAKEPGPWARQHRAEHDGGAETARRIARRLRGEKGR